MFVTTFYSFKGGVGRTLSLMNVAVDLARDDRKVLVVDFDLEAPGAQTYRICSSAIGQPGLIEFVLQYLEEDIVPDISNFIYSCPLDEVTPSERGVPKGELHILPAGNMDSAYGSRFGRIDWRNLYESRDGYLLVEDMKAQWRELGFDYVLIDSRTGHTDTGGICTRQLPDLVVAAFFPNEQNLVGLKDVVADIRSEATRTDAPIDLTFVASRLPRLDDEDSILKDILSKFGNEIGFASRDLIQVYHYDSLILLEQEIFAVKRLKTRMYAEYSALKNKLVSFNVEDPEGAYRYIKDLQKKADEALTAELEGAPSTDIEDVRKQTRRLSLLFDYHSNDPLIMHLLSYYYKTIGDLNSARAAIDRAADAIKNPPARIKTPEALAALIHSFRASLLDNLGKSAEAKDSALYAIRSSHLPAGLLSQSLAQMALNDISALPKPEEIPSLEKLNEIQFADLIGMFDQSCEEVLYGASLVHFALRKWNPLPPAIAVSGCLPLIASGRCLDAIRILENYCRDHLDLRSAFNLAMAYWGKEGQPSKERFKLCIDLFEPGKESDSPNLHQCIAVALAVVGRREEALEYFGRARDDLSRWVTTFSCWSYLSVDNHVFNEECDQIEHFIHEGVGAPKFATMATVAGA